MIDPEHDLPITRQAEVLRISRGSVYYRPRPIPESDLEIMRRLDRLHLEFSFAGSRARDKIDRLPVAPLLAEVIRRLHEGRGLSDLSCSNGPIEADRIGRRKIEISAGEPRPFLRRARIGFQQ